MIRDLTIRDGAADGFPHRGTGLRMAWKAVPRRCGLDRVDFCVLCRQGACISVERYRFACAKLERSTADMFDEENQT